MRIAFVTSVGVNKHGGTQKSVAWLVEDLAKEHDVSILAPQVRDIKAAKIKFHKVPTINRPAILRYFTFLFSNTVYLALQKASGSNGFDIIDATGADCIFANVITAHYCVAAYLRLMNEGVVPRLRGGLKQNILNLSYRVYYFFTNLMERWLYSRKGVKLIIAVSEGLRRDIIEHHHRLPEEVVVVPNAFDEEMLIDEDDRAMFRKEIRAKYLISKDEILLLFVAGGHWMRKGLPLVVKALSYLNNRFKLVVVGRDNIYPYLVIAEENGVRDKIVFTGPSLDVKRFYAAADILVFPSYFEGFSLVTLEAQASGVPIVATRINGTEELIQDGYNGFFVRHDPRDIAQKIDILTNDEHLMKRMAENAKKSAMRFKREETAKRTLEAFEKALSGKI